MIPVAVSIHNQFHSGFTVFSAGPLFTNDDAKEKRNEVRLLLTNAAIEKRTFVLRRSWLDGDRNW
jgi:hypothetical protein